MSELLKLDWSLFTAINQTWAHPWVDVAMLWLTNLGHHPWWLIIIPLWLIGQKGFDGLRVTIALLIALALSDLAIATIIKPLVARPRPFAAMEGVRLLSPHSDLSLYSFPSAHASNITALCLILCLWARKWWAWLLGILTILFVGYSRIYMGVHFPSDVIGGFLWGLVATGAGYAVLRKKIKQTETSFQKEKPKTNWLALALIFLAAGVGYMAMDWVGRMMSEPFPKAPYKTVEVPPNPPVNYPERFPIKLRPKNTPKPKPSPTTSKQDLDKLKRQMIAQLNKKDTGPRLLDFPDAPPKNDSDKFSRAVQIVAQQDKARVEGIQTRTDKPLAVVISNDVNTYPKPKGGKPAYTLQTGDFVRITGPADPQTGRIPIHPGADIFLAKTSKETEIAGTLLPDQSGWVEAGSLHKFDKFSEKDFTQGTEPITLGSDPNFSTVSFYERAFNNPDPVVHRVIGPRLISLLSIHEDYVSTWGDLYRDPDGKIRSFALATLNERGVGNSRQIIEDLIIRLSELTQIKVQGEREAEAILILSILRESHHPRVASALTSFIETWKESQPNTFIEAAQAAIQATLR